MINGNSLRYPDDEISLKQKIDALNDKWYKFLCSKVQLHQPVHQSYRLTINSYP